MFMFIYQSITKVELWSVNHASIYENSESKIFLKYKILGWNI